MGEFKPRTATRWGLAGLGLVVAGAIPSFELVHFDRLGLVRGYRSPLQPEFDIAIHGRERAHALNEFFDGTTLPSCAVVAAGGFPFEYRGRSIDLLGLNDVAMAHASRDKQGKKGHASFDKATFYRLNPDLVLCELMEPSGTLARPLLVGQDIARWLKNITSDAQFWKSYHSVVIFRRERPRRVAAIASTGYVQQLKREGFEVEAWDEYVASGSQRLLSRSE